MEYLQGVATKQPSYQKVPAKKHLHKSLNGRVSSLNQESKEASSLEARVQTSYSLRKVGVRAGIAAGLALTAYLAGISANDLVTHRSDSAGLWVFSAGCAVGACWQLTKSFSAASQYLRGVRRAYSE